MVWYISINIPNLYKHTHSLTEIARPRQVRPENQNQSVQVMFIPPRSHRHQSNRENRNSFIWQIKITKIHEYNANRSTIRLSPLFRTHSTIIWRRAQISALSSSFGVQFQPLFVMPVFVLQRYSNNISNLMPITRYFRGR